MLIKDLTLTDFRVYAGENHFNLAPKKTSGRHCPIILFGGLNGAGKTTILSGVRLALYGRASLGGNVSQKRYEAFLLDSIHFSRYTKRAANTASVELVFTYSKLGVEYEYRVKRAWERKSKGVKESLTIAEDGQQVKGLSQEQAQGFLNELIPIGVSDLFFFDGEKIAELADNSGGAVLEQSIKKLLGLDVAERLSGDLTVLNRNLTKRSSAHAIQDDINAQKKALDEHRERIEKLRQQITTATAERAEVETRANQLQDAISERGGHFSTSRQELEKQLDQLNTERDELMSRLAVLLSDAAPIALADEFCVRVEQQVEQDLNTQRTLQANQALEASFAKATEHLKGKLDEHAISVVEKEFAALRQSSLESPSTQPVHDLTPSQAGKLFASLSDARQQKKEAGRLFNELERVETLLDELGAALARAPDDSLIANDFQNLQTQQQQLGKLNAQLEALKQQGREEANKAVEAARRLDKLYDDAAKSSDQQRMLDYINNANGLLRDFVNDTATTKVRALEIQFTECFAKLARKEDMNLNIEINPQTFDVALLAHDDRVIGKDELSAGEKQIFAIAVLEALAKTSGRQLPMIIDTPLGRLDSKHRSKLIEGYFPIASHQMIVLSTDTEVDESFYSELKPDIARAYKLEYDPNLGVTSVQKGYFWEMSEAF
ncbi:DNA sulfur modification protein DndD [Halomonas heilongjiangensis]|uniref:DNA sulfur modification protein DndD n=1 Tax=Halomonas heilongjiangensis TaxID=1387883 RepID=A0A2N7TQF1_9GAMM|nr:DNA sulfur modification protein DndD [Halomonas heilongjiangensis]PMR70409.1 DNA sulfur modification protein DndD [Halomonas heilongjiangensis]PXX91369.1 DNA sulfur modification protein DndD [Halomonas heilongjiangensis]